MANGCNLLINGVFGTPPKWRKAFSSTVKLENLMAAISLHIAHYNFCWRLREPGKSGKLRLPPAMECELADRLWTLEDLYDVVTEHDRERESLARYRRLAKKLGK